MSKPKDNETIAKERPILFSAPMVRAILSGAKTQTRRIYKPAKGYPCQDGEHTGNPNEASCGWDYGPCRHGRPLDCLWVRETWKPERKYSPEGFYLGVEVTYAADNAKVFFPVEHVPATWSIPTAKGNIPSIHMPRWASRITLEITDVRVERLQEIGYEDVLSEGVEAAPSVQYGSQRQDTIDGFQDLWESINGPDSWTANPWVWVVEFEEVK